MNIWRVDTNYFQLFHVAYMLPFFYAGVLVCKYSFTEYISNVWSLLVFFLLFICLSYYKNVPEQLIALIGILFSFSFCVNLSKIFPELYSSFRNYTYQIFLMGIFFQMGIRYLYRQLNVEHTSVYWLLYIASVLVGLYIPVLVSKGVEKTPNKLVRIFLGLK